MNKPTFFRLSSGLYINLYQITCLWPYWSSTTGETSTTKGQLSYKFNLAGEPETEYTMTEEEFNQIVDL